jgi:hypothetical protein
MFAPFFIMAIAMLAATSFVFWKRAQKLARTDYIRTFSLPKGLYNKLMEKHPDLSAKDCQLVGRGLRQYFLVYAQSGCRQISMPSQIVDDLWHEFILYTREYEVLSPHASRRDDFSNRQRCGFAPLLALCLY